MSNSINEFKGKYGFLSNFHIASMVIDDLVWPSVEHFFQAMKTVNKQHQDAIRMASSSSVAKSMGSKNGMDIPGPLYTRHFQIVLRGDWDIFKYAVMAIAIEAKFNQHPDLKEDLLKTYPMTLIEGNHWHDNIWGDCSCSKCKDIVGQNGLGITLMEYRHKCLFHNQYKSGLDLHL